jgi:hypothetical protein
VVVDIDTQEQSEDTSSSEFTDLLNTIIEIPKLIKAEKRGIDDSLDCS